MINNNQENWFSNNIKLVIRTYRKTVNHSYICVFVINTLGFANRAIIFAHVI